MTWILCSERTPSKNDEVLISGTTTLTGHRYVSTSLWNGTQWYTHELGPIDPRAIEIEAWQPFPEPYRP